MGKLSQAEVKMLADEWAETGRAIEKAEVKKNAELDPFIVEFNKKTKRIHAKHDPKIQKLRDKQTDIAAKVTAWLTAAGKPIVLDGTLAVAANEVAIGKRTIDPKTFFDKVKDHGSAFWDCLVVGIAKAEKLLGKTKVDEISGKESVLVATLKLK